MSIKFFQEQIARLVTRFGAKAFDEEMVKLIWAEVKNAPETHLKRIVDNFIGSRGPNRPPLIIDFRESIRALEAQEFKKEVKGASDMLKKMAPEQMLKHAYSVLSEDFGKIESIKDALEIAILRRRIGGHK